MNKLSNKPLFDPKHPEHDKFTGRAKKLAAVGAIAVGGAFLLLPTNSEQPKKNTVSHVVQPGETEWSIASGEGSNVAENAEKLNGAIEDIDKQVHNHVLIPGELIMLPEGSKNGNTSVGNVVSNIKK